MRDQASSSDPKGQQAETPMQIPVRGWKDVLVRSWREASEDNVDLVAAGVAFYGFLALVPLLGAIVLSYGLVASPETVVRNMQAMTSVMPADAARLIGDQLMNVVQTSGEKKGFGVVLALALALFGARKGAGSIMTSLNIAYEEKETRGFLMVNLTALAITAGAVIVAILAVIAITALGHLDSIVPGAPGAVLALGRVLTFVLLFLGGAAAAATLYRFGPSREKARWVWLTPGSLFSAAGWLLLTLGFGLYVASFGNYNATYGSLGAVVVLLTWLYLSSYVLMLGAELNSELEHQTARDTTSGSPAPLGTRGAWVADHVAGEGEDRIESPHSAPVQPAPGPKPATVHRPEPSYSGDCVAAWVTSRVASWAGVKKVGMVASGISTLGLALLRRPGKAKEGVLLLSSAATLAWLSRARDEEAKELRSAS